MALSAMPSSFDCALKSSLAIFPGYTPGCNMVTDAFKERSLLTAGCSKLNQCLQELVEESISAESFRIQVFIHFHYVTGLPKVHQVVNLVDDRNRPGIGGDAG
jgi:hypothetical protein